MKRKRKQIGSLFLAVCMVLTMLPIAAFAETGETESAAPTGESGTITSFAELDSDISTQAVEKGTAESELNLPNKLSVMVTSSSAIKADVSSYNTSTSDAPTSDAPTGDTSTSDAPTSDAPTSDSPTSDTPTSDAPTSDAPTSDASTESVAEEETVPEEKSIETTVPVSGWDSTPAYDGNTEGDYTFTPKLKLPEGLTIKSGVEAPTITVKVGDAKEPALAPKGAIMPLSTKTDDIIINETNFPDEKFRDWLKSNAITKEAAADDILTQDEIAMFWFFNMSNLQIADLTGIEHFTSLTTLICSNNQISELNVSSLSKLITLDCSNNQISELNVSGLTALQTLLCLSNQLRELNANGLTALKELYCYSNQLRELNVTDLTALKQLYCYSNQLRELNLSGLPALQTLLCNSNQLCELNVTGLERLENLYCSQNQISKLNVTGLLALERLECSSNQLRELNVTGLERLKNLCCPQNQISKLNVTGLLALEDLECSSNQLRELNLTGLERLETLYCSQNQISKLNVTGLLALEHLQCSNNYISSEADITGLDKIITKNFYFGHQTPYTVTFLLNGGNRNGGGELIQMVARGESARPPIVSRSNYTFAGWDKDLSNVTSDLTITANWFYNGGAGSSGSTVTATPEIPLDQPVTVTVPVVVSASKNGTAIATIPENSLTDALLKVQGRTTHSITVALNITMPKQTTSLTTNLTQNSLNCLVGAGVNLLEVNGAPVNLGLDKNALNQILRQSGGGNISITISPANGLSSEAKSLLGNRPTYSITTQTSKDGKTVNVTSLSNGTATLSIPYTPSKNETVGYLFGVYVDTNGKAQRIPGSAYDANSKRLLIPTNYLSVYGVGYTAPSAKFTDIGDHWGKDAIDYVVGRGLLSGTTETTFAPNTAITREALVTALGKLANIDTKAYTGNHFSDVKSDSAWRPYIEWGYSKGILQGISGNLFAPDQAITREEIAVIFTNFTKATGYTLPVTRAAVTYADAGSVGNTYKTAVTAMQQAGILMSGSENQFHPKSTPTRAEVAVMLHRYIRLTISPATTQGWALNDAGQYEYYKNGEALTGTQTIDGAIYFFGTDGTLKTGWVQNGGNMRYYSGNKLLVGFGNITVDGTNKTYYFDTYGNMVTGKWLQIDGKWYYLNADGTLARSTTIDGYAIDANGVRNTK
ncbi:S-layer homology domain-containing protein [Clostridium merdae]|uniref:S-layer homology domain-containing protein n=1 Tax=Clostridium merdae TaxID=1958780 RepID=UPI000A26CB42|nr:S-layer homology domain-containing protein [Clostridium merdae]